MVSPANKRAASARVFGEPFWDKHSDTSESGKEKPPVSQSLVGSESLRSRVQLASSFYTPKPMGWGRATNRDITA